MEADRRVSPEVVLETYRQIVRDPSALRAGLSGPPEQAEALPETPAAPEQQHLRQGDLLGRIERLEQALGAAQDQLLRYRELFELAPDAYLVTDLYGNIQEANWAATSLLCVPREFLVGKPLPFFATYRVRQQVYSRLARLKSHAETIRDWQVPFQARRGRSFLAVLSATVVLDPGGVPAGIRWLVRDVSVLKQAEEDLRLEKEFADTLLDTAQAIILLLDPLGRITRVNAYLENLLSCPRERLLGQEWCTALAVEEDKPRCRELVRELTSTHQGLHLVQSLVTRKGERRAIEWALEPLPDSTGEVSAVVAVGHDITERLQQQERMMQMERLATIGQVVAGLAHESRNAIQRGQACVEMLRWRLQDRPDALDLLVRMQRAQSDLLRMYEDVRGYAAPLHLEHGERDVSEVWRAAWDAVTAVGPPRDARLEEERCAADCRCRVDGFRLEQVFRNLLDNALAACPDPVRVRIACRDAVLDGRPALRISVRDNGPGLNADQQRRLFEPFFTTKVKGTGLGLALSRRIVEAHGGRIELGEAGPGGAEFVITLPRGTP